ncbi:ABC transporter permease subunit [Streptomyces sp. DW26H14]|uniref:ABC transporter permease subunit n=1 Tax=Streptomyces sp. DW26H14 TaxID=3435395 RepID=UPI00403E0FB1
MSETVGTPGKAPLGPGGSPEPVAPGSAGRGRRVPALALNVIAVACGIAVWALLAANGVGGLPGPLAVARRGAELLGDGTLEGDMLASLRRVFTGFALGTVSAVVVGFLMGWYPVVRALFEPYVQFFRTVPPLALIPLAIMLMGIGETPKIFVIFLAAFLSSVVATLQGMVGVDRTLIDAARVLGAGDRTIFLRVVIPASAPFILVGMRIGLGSAWATLVAAELIAAQQGLGFRMQHAETYYDLDTIFVGLIAIGVLGLVMDRLLLLAERRLTQWQERR